MQILKNKFKKKLDLKQKMIVAMIVATLVPAFLSGIVSELVYYKIYDDEAYEVSDMEDVVLDYIIGANQFVESINSQFKGVVNGEDLIKVFKESNDLKKYEGLDMLLMQNHSLYYQSNNLISDRTIEVEIIGESSMKLVNEQFLVVREENYIDKFDNDIEMLLVLDGGGMFKDAIEYFIAYIASYIIIMSISIISLLFWIKRSLDLPLKGIKEATYKMKCGDLDTPLTYENDDEFKELANSIEELRRSLKESIGQQRILEEEKSQIIRNVSHDLRTPLTAIRGYVQGIKDGVAKDQDTINEYLDTIQLKANAVDSLINDLKVLSDLDDEIEDYQFRKLDLVTFLKDCVEDMSFDVKQVNGQIALFITDDQCIVNVDPLKLKRVFTNIITNSIKYRSNDPLRLKIGVECEKELVFIRVTDNGIGIDMSLKDKIFDRFFRADIARGSDTGGSGIGLSICKEIMSKHNGTIEAFPGITRGLTIEMSFKLRGELDETNINSRR